MRDQLKHWRLAGEVALDLLNRFALDRHDGFEIPSGVPDPVRVTMFHQSENGVARDLPPNTPPANSLQNRDIRFEFHNIEGSLLPTNLVHDRKDGERFCWSWHGAIK